MPYIEQVGNYGSNAPSHCEISGAVGISKSNVSKYIANIMPYWRHGKQRGDFSTQLPDGLFARSAETTPIILHISKR